MKDDLISRLSELRCQHNCFDENERDAYHTLSEAIKVLSDVPDTNVGDIISRQAAINMLIRESQADGAYGYLDAKSINNALERMPSADVQPHQLTEEDLTELRHRFGNKVERVVRDMISGKEERWMT